jgi:hypothetical protein
MAITVHFALQVLALRREYKTVAQIAAELHRTEDEVLKAHKYMGVGVAMEEDQPPRRPPARIVGSLRGGTTKSLRSRSGPRIDFVQVAVVNDDRSGHKAFMCPITISRLAFELRTDRPRKEVVYFNENAMELMRVPFAEMPEGQWVW